MVSAKLTRPCYNVYNHQSFFYLGKGSTKCQCQNKRYCAHLHYCSALSKTLSKETVKRLTGLWCPQSSCVHGIKYFAILQDVKNVKVKTIGIGHNFIVVAHSRRQYRPIIKSVPSTPIKNNFKNVI